MKGLQKRFTTCVVVAIALAFLLVSAALALTFLYPREVAFRVGAVSADPDRLKVSARGFGLALPLNVTITSRNFFDLALTQINVQATHPLYKDVLGNGTVRELMLPKRSEAQATFAFSMNYERNRDGGGYITQLLKNCTASRGVYFDVATLVHYRMFLKSGSKSVNQPMHFDCPIDAQTAAKVLFLLMLA